MPPVIIPAVWWAKFGFLTARSLSLVTPRPSLPAFDSCAHHEYTVDDADHSYLARFFAVFDDFFFPVLQLTISVFRSTLKINTSKINIALVDLNHVDVEEGC